MTGGIATDEECVWFNFKRTIQCYGPAARAVLDVGSIFLAAAPPVGGAAEA